MKLVSDFLTKREWDQMIEEIGYEYKEEEFDSLINHISKEKVKVIEKIKILEQEKVDLYKWEDKIKSLKEKDSNESESRT